MNIKRSILIRVRIAFLFVFLFGIAIVVKISHIQFIEGEEWTKISEQITFDYKKVKATRGNIYSDNGSLLATDLPFYKVAFDPRLAKDRIFKSGIDSLSILLARYFKDRSATDYKRMMLDARAANRQYII
ncbi:MAG TPA: cell division protein, partial [Cyclobacteriaceae bacterium]